MNGATRPGRSDPMEALRVAEHLSRARQAGETERKSRHYAALSLMTPEANQRVTSPSEVPQKHDGLGDFLGAARRPLSELSCGWARTGCCRVPST